MGIDIEWEINCWNNCSAYCDCPETHYLNCIDVLTLNLETAAAMEITRQSAYSLGWSNAMAIKGICEPLEDEHAKRVIALSVR